MYIQLCHISQYRKEASKNTNCHIIEIPGLKLAFSYSTIIGFLKPGKEWQLIENNFSDTTGVHLNLLDPDKKKRLPEKEFKEALFKAWPVMTFQEYKEYFK